MVCVGCVRLEVLLGQCLAGRNKPTTDIQMLLVEKPKHSKVRQVRAQHK